MKTETDLDEICRELVEWKDGWEWCEDGSYYQPSFLDNGNFENRISRLKGDLNLVRELEEAVFQKEQKLFEDYLVKLWRIVGKGRSDIQGTHLLGKDEFIKLFMADPEPRLRALHRTLREANEIQQEG